ncbi:adenine phosphoribosyltransferase [Alteriqipengyuania sp.]|uniref:adenine phosphoribosyltransferase n=2 Tax=Alteriqipengyuania sp. TaxID=2800692 RepID=UPI003515D540
MARELLDLTQLRASIRTVPDFPKPGIQFRDITTLLADPAALHTSIELMARQIRAVGADMVAGMEARGFIFGAAVAASAGVGFIPIRKPGKLPGETIGVDYELEYGMDRLELDPGTITGNAKVSLVDDLVATGGTALAAAELVRKAGGEVASALFVIDLPDLGGANRLRESGIEVHSLVSFEGD